MRRRDALAVLATAFAPRAFAQKASAKRRLGLLLLVPIAPLTEPFFAALAERGWQPTNNLEVITRVTAADQPRATELAHELLASGAELLVTVGTANAVAARKATATVPIVMLASGYPVESGLAQSLARPGGNVTGLSIYGAREVFGKYVALTTELVPSLRQLGVFWGYAPPAYPAIETDIALGEMTEAAKRLGIPMRVWRNRDARELARHLDELRGVPLEALFVSAGGPQSVPETIAAIADSCEERRLPTVCDVAGAFFARGGVVAYSADFSELARRCASFVDRILRGANPAGLPIELPTRFELVVNLKRARAIGMTIPPGMLARADRVIE